MPKRSCPKCDADISDSYENADPSVGIIRAGWYCDACDEWVDDDWEGPDFDIPTTTPGAHTMIFDEQAIEAAAWIYFQRKWKVLLDKGSVTEEKMRESFDKPDIKRAWMDDATDALQAALDSLKERGFSIVKDGYKFVHGPNCPCTDCT